MAWKPSLESWSTALSAQTESLKDPTSRYNRFNSGLASAGFCWVASARLAAGAADGVGTTASGAASVESVLTLAGWGPVVELGAELAEDEASLLCGARTFAVAEGRIA